MIIGIKEDEIRPALDEFLRKTNLSLMDIYVDIDMVNVSLMNESNKKLIQPKLTIVLHIPDNLIKMEE